MPLTIGSLSPATTVFNRHTKVWAHVNVLPDLAAQPPVEQMNGLAARERLERITATGVSYFVGVGV